MRIDVMAKGHFFATNHCCFFANIILVIGFYFNVTHGYIFVAGELLDQTDIKSNDIVAGATLNMNVWPMWKDLIEACSTNDIDWVQ